MKRLAFALFGFLALVTAAFANFGNTGGHLTGFWQKPLSGGPASITFLQCAADIANQTTYDFTSQNTGTASADRYTGIGVLAEDGAATFSVSTLTVGGDSASLVTSYDAVALTGYSGIYILANPSGTSETVSVTFSEAVTSATICLWQINNISSGTATDSASQLGSPTATLDIDVPALGVAFGVGMNTGAAGFTWTGLTEREDTAGAEIGWTGADYTEDASASSPLSVTVGRGAGNTAGSAASFF